MISYDQALQQVIETLAPLAPEERFLPEAAGCVLADPAIARWDMPRCDNSAMDGFAVSGNAAGNNRSLKIIGASYAGTPFTGNVQAGQAVRITTGACLPSGTDTVIPLEDVAEEQGSVHPQAKVARGQHVRRLGEEFRSDEALAAAGTLLGAGEIGCWRAPVSTGSGSSRRHGLRCSRPVMNWWNWAGYPARGRSSMPICIFCRRAWPNVELPPIF